MPHTKRVKPSPNDIPDLLAWYAHQFGIDVAFVMGVAQQESGFRQSAISSSGAIGVMQLMPGTARGLGVNPYNTDQNIKGGVELLARYLRAYKGDLVKVLIAYNAGPGTVQRWNGNYGSLPTQTQAYIKDILGQGGTMEQQGGKNNYPTGFFPKLPPVGSGGSTNDPIIGYFNGIPIRKNQFDQYWKGLDATMGAYGYGPMSRQQAEHSLQMNLTSETLGWRLAGMRLSSDNHFYLSALEKETGKKMSNQDRWNFFLGAANPAWYQKWGNVVARASASQAGITVGRRGDLSLTLAQIRGVEKSGGLPVTSAQQNAVLQTMKQYASIALTYFPESRFRGMNLKKQQVLDFSEGRANAMTEDELNRLKGEVDSYYQVKAGGAFARDQSTRRGPGRGAQLM